MGGNALVSACENATEEGAFAVYGTARENCHAKPFAQDFRNGILIWNSRGAMFRGRPISLEARHRIDRAGQRPVRAGIKPYSRELVQEIG